MNTNVLIKKVESVEDCKVCDEMFEELVLYETQFDGLIIPQPFNNRYERTLNREDTIIFLATANNKPAGYVMAYKQDKKAIMSENIVTIMNIFVKPDFRKCGIGKLLIDKVEKWAKEQHETYYIEIDCYINNKTAMEFYSKLNYKNIRVKMRKRI